MGSLVFSRAWWLVLALLVPAANPQLALCETAVVLEGDTAPGTGGGTYLRFHSPLIAAPSINSFGDLAFRADVLGGSVDHGIFVLSGGVNSVVTYGRDRNSAQEAEIYSDRLEILLDPKTREARELHAQQLFRLNHPRFACEGGTLSVNFETRWMQLRSASELCSFVGTEEKGRAFRSRFKELRYHLDTEALEIDSAQLFVEVDRGR